MLGHRKMRPKAKEKDKQCAYCDRTFTKEEHLKRHERSHTGEKPFKCQKCDRRYGRSDVLARHLQTHPLNDLLQVSRINRASEASANILHNKDTSEQAMEDTSISRVENHHIFQPSLQPFPLSDRPQTFGDDTFRPSIDVQAAFAQSQLTLLNDNLGLGSLSQAQQHAHVSSVSDFSVAAYPAIANSWDNATHLSSERHGSGEWEMMASLSQVSPRTSSMLDAAALDGSAPAFANASPTPKTTPSQPSLWQIMRDQGALRPESRKYNASARPTAPEVDQTDGNDVETHSSDQSPSLEHHLLDRFEIDPFLFNADFSAHHCMSPGILDYLGMATPPPPVFKHPSVNIDTEGKLDIWFSIDQLQKMRQLWRNRRSAPTVRIIRSLWHSIVHHKTDNIFSQPAGGTVPLSPTGVTPRNSHWGIDESCRTTMIEYCKELDEKMLPEDSADLTPRSTPPSTTTESGPGIPGSSLDGFPTTEVLDASVDLFFQCSHLPFFHRATFDAKKTSKALLLPICLVGLSSLYPERSKDFVLRYVKKLMRVCRSDLTAKALGRCQVWEFLESIASTLLVLYLGLGYLEDLDERQAHMLSAQVLHITERHGFFNPAEGEDLILELQAGPTDREGSWKAWNRVESVKRMISCLLWMDMAYTRLMGSAGVLDMDKIELHLPCEAALFEAVTSSRFLQAAQRGARLVEPRVHMCTFHSNPPSKMNHVSMETLLVVLYLQIAVMCHKLPTTNHKSLDTREMLAKSSKIKDVVKTILMLPSKYAELFRQRHKVTVYAWNNVCIALTADLNLLELASGREGLEPARTAMIATVQWAQTSSARRAILHASQIFDVLSSSRLSESNIARPDLLLFNCALVLSMYLSLVHYNADDHDSPAFELLQEVDWKLVAAEGLRGGTQTMPPSPHTAGRPSSNPAEAARHFIKYGGPVSFAGEIQEGGSATARRMLLHCVRLLENLGKWRDSRYSQLLRTMSDFVIEGNG